MKEQEQLPTGANLARPATSQSTACRRPSICVNRMVATAPPVLLVTYREKVNGIVLGHFFPSSLRHDSKLCGNSSLACGLSQNRGGKGERGEMTGGLGYNAIGIRCNV